MPGKSLPTSQSVITASQPALKTPNTTITYSQDGDANKTNIGTRGTACKGGKGGSAHGNGSDGVGAIVAEGLRTVGAEKLRENIKISHQLELRGAVPFMSFSLARVGFTRGPPAQYLIFKKITKYD